MLQFALRLGDAAAGGGDDDAAEHAAAAGADRGAGDGGDAGADRGEPDAPGARAFSTTVTARYGGTRAGAAGARRRVRARRRGALWTLGDAGGGAGAAARRARPGRGGGRPAGDQRRGRRRMRHRRRGRRAGAGRRRTGRREVIADGSVRGVSPQAWAERAVELFHAHDADRLVAEVNQGGDMVADADPRRSTRWCRSGRCGRPAARRCAPSRWRRSTSRGGSRIAAAFRELEDADGGDDGRRLRRAGQPRPGRRAGLGDHRPDDRAGERLPVAARRGRSEPVAARGRRDPSEQSGASFMVLQIFRTSPGSRRRPRPRPRRRWWPSTAPGGWPGRRATPRR